jgi:hypothetical protein
VPGLWGAERAALPDQPPRWQADPLLARRARLAAAIVLERARPAGSHQQLPAIGWLGIALVVASVLMQTQSPDPASSDDFAVGAVDVGDLVANGRQGG